MSSCSSFVQHCPQQATSSLVSQSLVGLNHACHFVITAVPNRPPVGCWLVVGMLGVRQPLSLQANICIYVGTVIHELMLAVDSYHEHTRNDHDDYVTVHLENVEEGKEGKFCKDTYWRYVGEDYNHDSIMHYGTYASADWGVAETIVPTDLNVVLVEAYDKLEMTQADANEINNLYASESARRKD
ncbi:astacin-like [Eriocheir sinensis]|uniref:astacin-like n=1 Tax=Eriocheir sinensis TaxID=95602 RepID=UPI0021CA0B88|nr:astacin-like [Eriocheir sinensis]